MRTNNEAECQAFCSTANLGSGFDVFGLALKKYSDRVRVRTTKRSKIRILVKGTPPGAIPKNPNRNSAGPPARALLERAGLGVGLDITIRKGVPYGLGLGSSGATAAACSRCVDHLLGLNLNDDELVRVASLGERAVTGATHADNVAASMLGGFTIVYDSPIRTISLRPPKGLAIVVVTPESRPRKGKTRMARKLVPKSVNTRRAVLNVGRASAIVSGFAGNDIARIGSGMRDEIAEPYRERSIPGIKEAREAGLRAGAAGVAISGAGPSLIALLDKNRRNPQSVASAIVSGFRQARIESRSFITEPAPAAMIVEG